MKIKRTTSLVCLLLLVSLLTIAARAQKPTKKPAAKSAPAKSQGGARKTDEQLKAEFDALFKLPVAERIERLRAFIEANPKSSLVLRATEQLVSAHAAVGDEKLQAGDAAGGIDYFKRAVALAPADMSDKLYFEVVSQLPANLFLRGQGAAALELARAVEAKAGADSKRLLALAAFYISVERADEAARVAEAASKLSPNLAAPHEALGAAHRLSLRLDEAVAEYTRAVELDPRAVGARHSLADLRRATGKSEEALTLYRELLAADASDRAARAGLVLALFDAGKREEAERELETALRADPNNLPLLVGAGYWYAGHGEAARATEFAGQAVRIEPRYTWAQIALARALVGNKMPLEAERALRFARQYGRFPTLDYELANALVAAGLFNEAFDELARSFTLKDGQLETRLAGSRVARAADFIELLAPERRASIFQPNAADTESNARVIKGLLALHLALAADTDATATTGDASVVAAANDFASGADEMRSFRQLYAANRLLRRGVALQTALELVDGARSGIDAATDAPPATVATTAEELREVRASAISQGGTPDIPTLPRNAISNILRGRVEDMTGWALLSQGKAADAVTALRRAVSVLPDKSIYWRAAQWRLGTALAASGNERDALAAYIKSYNTAAPDAARRAVIESLYTKLNGSPAGLDAEVGPAPARASIVEASSATPQPAPAASETRATETKPAETKTSDAKPDEPKPSEAKADDKRTDDRETERAKADSAKPTETPAPTVTATPEPSPVNTVAAPVVAASPEASPSASPESPVANPSPEASPAPTPSASPAQSATPEPSPTPVAVAANEATPTPTATPAESSATPTAQPSPQPTTAPTPDATPSPARSNDNAEATPERGDAKKTSVTKNGCTLTLSVGSMLLSSNGGSASVVASLEGSTNLAGIGATTASWSDIIILREPQGGADTTSLKFTVTFKSPCGSQDVNVSVK